MPNNARPVMPNFPYQKRGWGGGSLAVKAGLVGLGFLFGQVAERAPSNQFFTVRTFNVAADVAGDDMRSVMSTGGSLIRGAVYYGDVLWHGAMRTLNRATADGPQNRP